MTNDSTISFGEDKGICVAKYSQCLNDQFYITRYSISDAGTIILYNLKERKSLCNISFRKCIIIPKLYSFLKFIK